MNGSVRVHLYTVTYGGCVSSFLRIQQSSTEPPYVAGISADIASSLRGIIRSILIREDYPGRIFAPARTRFTTTVDRAETFIVLFIEVYSEYNKIIYEQKCFVR